MGFSLYLTLIGYALFGFFYESTINIIAQLLFLLGCLFFLAQNCFTIHHSINILRPIRIWLYCYLVVFALALLSLFFCSNAIYTAKAIVLYLLRPLILFLCCYMIAFDLPKEKEKEIFVIASCIFAIHSISTICVHFLYNPHRATGFLKAPIISYAFFLTTTFVIGLTLLIFSRYKKTSILIIILALLSIIYNGTRSSYVAILIISSLTLVYLFFYFTHLRNTLISLSSLLVLLIVGFAVSSEKIQTQYNAIEIIKKTQKIWNSTPSEMGSFDFFCNYKNYMAYDTLLYYFNNSKVDYLLKARNSGLLFPPFSNNRIGWTNPITKQYLSSIFDPDKICKNFNGQMGDFFVDPSILQRLSMWKSTLMIIKQNPLKPLGFYPLLYAENIPKKYPSYFYPYVDKWHIPHIHNGFLSAFLELGLVGGAFYCLLFAIALYWGIRMLQKLKWEAFFFTAIIIVSIVQNITEPVFAFFCYSASFMCLAGFLCGTIIRKSK